MSDQPTSPTSPQDKLHTAIILAAGFGTRLRPFTAHKPKPLLPVLGRPLIRYALDHASRAGCREVLINAHHLADAFAPALGDSYRGMTLRYSVEEKILGTGGGIARMMSMSKDPGPFLVLNSDALCDFDVRELIQSHFASGAVETMLLKETADMGSYGTIATAADGRVVDFVGRASAPGDATRRGMFVGAHIMARSVLDGTSPDEESCVNTVAVPRAMKAGGRVQGVFTTGDFSDVGTPERLLAANTALLNGTFSHRFLARPEPDAQGNMIASRAFVDKDATLTAPVFIGEGAQVHAGAVVGPAAIIGPRVSVEPDALFQHAVAMDSTQVAGAHRQCLMSETHAVQVEPPASGDA